MKTTNGGINWISVPVDSSVVGGFPIKSISFYNRRIGFACGGFIDLAGVIWRTTNYGVNWQATGVSPEPLVEMAFNDSINIVGVGGDFEFGPGMVKTRDGGDNWNYRTLELFGIPSSLALRKRNELWITMGVIPTFLFAPDSTYHFVEIPTPDNKSIYDITFINERIGFCAGDSGAIYKYNPDLVSVNNYDSGIPTEYKLFQNYPNPFNPSTKIKYQIPFAGLIRISIYDILGREIETIINQYQQAGTFETQWNASKHTSGIYYYRMSVNDYTSSKIMVLVK
jgi:hypothetical protein